MMKQLAGIVSVCLALSIACPADAAEILIKSCKAELAKAPENRIAEEDFFKTAPAYKIDTSLLKPEEYPGCNFTVNDDEAQKVAGKQISFRMRVKRMTGKDPLTSCFRLWKLQNGQWEPVVFRRFLPFQAAKENEFELYEAKFQVPDMDFSHFDVQVGVQQMPNAHDVWILDEPEFFVVDSSGSSGEAKAADSIGMAAIEDKEPLVLVKDGKVEFTVLLGDKADAVAKYAAEELCDHVRMATGKSPEIKKESEFDGKSPAVYIGDTEMARKYSVNPSALSLETIVNARIGNSIILSGGDHGNLPASSCYSFTKVAVGTLYAVYEFLESQFGVRWYWPGKDGTCVPQVSKLKINDLFMAQKPVYGFRDAHLYAWRDPDISAKEFGQFFRRLRLGSSKGQALANHSYNNWVEKYGEAHPEYFALQPDGTRKTDSRQGGHPCFSNPEVFNATVAEKVEALRNDRINRCQRVMPGDSFSQYRCRCKECEKQYEPEKGESGYATRYVWDFVNSVAAEVAEKMPDGKIACCAYEQYSTVPDFHLNPNVVVTVCCGTAPHATAGNKEKILKVFDAWAKTGAELYQWQYWTDTRLMRDRWGAPAVFPRQLKEMNLLTVGKINGVFINLSECVPGKDQGDWPYDALNLYVASKLFWDPNADVEKTLGDYYRNFFGPAAETVRRFDEEMEKTWSRRGIDGDGLDWNFETIWYKIYPPEFVDRMMGLLRQAVKETEGQEPYFYRTKRLLKGYSSFENVSKRFRQKAPTNTPVLNVPAIGGKPDKASWGKAAVINKFCDSYNVNQQKAETEMRFLHDDKFLYVLVDCEFPAERKIINWSDSRAKRDAPVYENEGVELFFAGPGDKKIQYVISPGDRLADYRYPAGEPAKWDSEKISFSAEHDVSNKWHAEIAIPLEDLAYVPRQDDGSLKVNFFRNHLFKNSAADARFELEQSGWFPSYGAYGNIEKFGKMYLK